MAKNAAELFDQIMGAQFPALMAEREPNADDVGLLLAGQNPPKGVRLIPPLPVPMQEHQITHGLLESDDE